MPLNKKTTNYSFITFLSNADSFQTDLFDP